MQRRRFLAATAGVLVYGPRLVASAAFEDAQSSRDQGAHNVKGNGQIEAGRYARVNGETDADRDTQAARWYDRERRIADTSFGHIAYVDRGNGPAALFVHGFPLSSFQWRGAIERLSARRRCIAPDLMGLGCTQVASNQAVTPTAQAEMLVTFLNRLGIAEVDVIANDSGGAVAQLLLVRQPQRVRSLLLTNCNVENDSPPARVLSVIELARAGIYPELWLEPWLQHKDVARSPTDLGGTCYSNPAHPTDAAIEQYLRPLVATPERKALVNRYLLGLAPNPLAGIEHELRRCKAPVRIVWGMGDTLFSRKSPDYLASVFPRVVGIRRLPDAKPLFPEEYPDVIAEEAVRLWNERPLGANSGESS